MQPHSQRSLIPQEEKQRAEIAFQEADSVSCGNLGEQQFLIALRGYLGREVQIDDLPSSKLKESLKGNAAGGGGGEGDGQVKINFRDFLRAAYFLKLKFEHKLSESEEKFLLDNFSKREIQVFISEWETIDTSSQGVLPLHHAGTAIQGVLGHYLDSRGNDSLLKQFYIEKAGKDVEYREYIHFIGHFLQTKKYTFHRRKTSVSCSCAIF